MKALTKMALVSLLAVFLSGTWASAYPDEVKVLLERSGSQIGGPPADLFARLEARPLRFYPAFTVISVSERRRHEIESMAQGVGFQATVQEEWDRVFLPGGFTVDTPLVC